MCITSEAERMTPWWLMKVALVVRLPDTVNSTVIAPK